MPSAPALRSTGQGPAGSQQGAHSGPGISGQGCSWRGGPMCIPAVLSPGLMLQDCDVSCSWWSTAWVSGEAPWWGVVSAPVVRLGRRGGNASVRARCSSAGSGQNTSAASALKPLGSCLLQPQPQFGAADSMQDRFATANPPTKQPMRAPARHSQLPPGPFPRPNMLQCLVLAACMAGVGSACPAAAAHLAARCRGESSLLS